MLRIHLSIVNGKQLLTIAWRLLAPKCPILPPSYFTSPSNRVRTLSIIPIHPNGPYFVVLDAHSYVP